MNYKVLSHDYTHTGGNCMVSTFQVWLEDENKTVFLHMTKEGGTLATCDYINHEIDIVEDMMLENFNVELIGDDDKYLELYRYCYFEYLKKDCIKFRTSYSVRLIMFPTEYLSNIRNEYIEWHLENIGDCFETNGYELILDPSYVEPDPEILEAKAMLQYMDSVFDEWHEAFDESLNEKFYNLDASVTFGEKTFAIKNCAAIYEAIQSCLKEFIDNY